MEEAYKQYFKKDQFAASNGISLLICKPGYAKAQVQIEERHLNGAGVVHGGLIFTLADFCFGVATNTYGQVSLSINASISFLAKSNKGVLTAECKEISRNNKLSICDINVYNEEDKLLANFKGTAYITKEKIEF
ncbi:MAG: hotdog fold thioesterase [Paludibacteraceae bacterium]|nr:hotdog fold thioesterase [Paludibacteraceae bacterium]MBN2788335.1 hotdog fold thioesterase [Paludibacteraceae bacterium]